MSLFCNIISDHRYIVVNMLSLLLHCRIEALGNSILINFVMTLAQKKKKVIIVT